MRHAAWDGEWICHHALSNDTHRLSDLASRALIALEPDSPQTELQLAGALDLDVGSVAELLRVLESLDFVERCP